MTTVAMLTDFGLDDWYVAEVKGSILSVHQSCQIIDISHSVKPGDIQSAAFILKTCFRAFPTGTVFCAIVDPEVGSERKGIAAYSEGYFFVGPDNGLLSWALLEMSDIQVHRIENRVPNSPSKRVTNCKDTYGPVAASLTSGYKIEQLGTRYPDYVKLAFPSANISNESISGVIIYFDKYGNAITSISAQDILRTGITYTEAYIDKNGIQLPMKQFYSQVPPNAPLAYIGSTEYVEIAVHSGNAREKLNLELGDEICIKSNY